MKRLLALGMSTVLALPILSTAVVFAEDTIKPTTTAPTKVEIEKPPTADELKLVTERIQKRKIEFKTKLKAPEKLRIQNKCKASQGLISSTTGRLNGIETSRTEVHKNIIDRLIKLSEKLKAKGADTTQLNADTANLQGKIDAFNTDLATYKQTVGDVAAMGDCTTNPDGFKASLDAARTALEKVNQDSQAIKGYVNDTIKPLLKSIRAELEAKKNEKSTSTTEGSR